MEPEKEKCAVHGCPNPATQTVYYRMQMPNTKGKIARVQTRLCRTCATTSTDHQLHVKN